MNNTMKKAACAALGLALAMSLAGCGSTGAASPSAEPVPEITVSASSTVRLTPDKATVSFGVTTREDTAELAQSKNSEAVRNVMDVLTARGIEEKSIRTDSYNMYPQYDWSEGGEQRIIGYMVTTSMSVRDRDIEELGTCSPPVWLRGSTVWITSASCAAAMTRLIIRRLPGLWSSPGKRQRLLRRPPGKSWAILFPSPRDGRTPPQDTPRP